MYSKSNCKLLHALKSEHNLIDLFFKKKHEWKWDKAMQKYLTRRLLSKGCLWKAYYLILVIFKTSYIDFIKQFGHLGNVDGFEQASRTWLDRFSFSFSFTLHRFIMTKQIMREMEILYLSLSVSLSLSHSSLCLQGCKSELAHLPTSP